MKKDDIIPWDWHRILFGQAPPEYLIEVFLRTSLIYIALLVIIRAMGKRMGGQLSISEMAIMVTLGAIVSPAMQIPQLGLLMGVMILVCALVFRRGVSLAEFSSRKFEKISQGTTQMLVKDGIIQIDQLEMAKVSRQQLFAALRDENVFNLGDVGRVYMEAFGCFSIYMNAEPAAGLCIFPPSDTSIECYSQRIVEEHSACINCGNVAPGAQESQTCEACGSDVWIPAAVSVKYDLIDK
ncbi:DUF421 domain-containing protein [Dyadobacter sp. Leaf189]|uniref:DUF421 domain-containing protein n=1 Tax=Dyadobacter sp. Leaf189 TaxID=1736295 RepID=UPI0006FC67DD|nr:YetF domain-containing protein [Dyadobacter sp. Leaf189]KQS27812.1 hypothetical protein ASG33_15440 [Dyadobacter sp. Leaf189]